MERQQLERYPMEFNELLHRYFYLGNDRPFYIHRNRSLDVDRGCRILTPIKELVEAILKSDGGPPKGKVAITTDPVTTVVNVIRNGSLIRNNECLFVLAYLARVFVAQEEKHKVYEQIPQVIDTSRDLFMFIHFYSLLGPVAIVGKGKGFGYGLRGALTKWYDKYSPEKLAVLLASDPSWNNWHHKDILRMVHINLKNEAKRKVIDAAIANDKDHQRKSKPTKQQTNSLEINDKLASLALDANSPKNNDNVAEENRPEAAPLPQDQNVRGEAPDNDAPADGAAGDGNAPQENRVEGEQPESQTESALEIFKRIKKFKACKTATEACEGIEKYKYSFHLIPNQLHRSQAVWESAFPNMSYEQIVESMLVLQDYKLLTEEDTPFSIKYSSFLNNMTAVKQSGVSPIFMYRVLRLYEEKQRFLDTVKEAVHTTNNLILKSLSPNFSILKQTYGALNCSMLNLKRTGLNYMITLDLRSKITKKRVFGNRLMSCQAASVLLALPILKCEKQVHIFTFTEIPNRLENVEFTREMSLAVACDEIQRQAGNKKTKVDINHPCRYAHQREFDVDVFITIVDSLIRVNPQRKSPASALQVYNSKMNKKACYILINLCRHQQDLVHQATDKPGVLEITGCSEDTMKVIDSYVNRCFT
ncbi:RNA-binding protein RO60-like [Toxorhynchites rutilus septentrionalis]|uniref:RNA-binding protein RO60-like n=1 Tax=Toxorhynchites rutilus septentrionalis TaxID=329112 RepID=UPI0024790962|nr:RNA-binding protein RO60-like [Toxorhynchites rutilus septentrionalis]XP_055638033.1 RNA-binding protein RO60-like [Toxorhynchites rutilus septentrionalis]